LLSLEPLVSAQADDRAPMLLRLFHRLTSAIQ